MAGMMPPQSYAEARERARVHENRGFLTPLRPLTVTPSESSERSRMVTALRRIELLHVVRSSGKAPGPSYDIHVYYKMRQHHISLTGRQLMRQCEWVPPSHPSHRSPDAVVQRSLPELSKLHADLFQLARTGHGLELCAFCHTLVSFCGYSRVKPRSYMTWLYSNETVEEKLSMYLSEVL
jgi:hypothetical protein